MTLLAQMETDRARQRECLRQQVRAETRSALIAMGGLDQVLVFGSLTRAGKFTEFSDVDLAIETEPRGRSSCQLMGLLAEALGRAVDVVVLDECRFAEKIRREGEVWTLRD